MNNDELLETWVTLVHVKEAIGKIRHEELKQYHISPEQSGVLSILYTSHKSLTPADIARALFRDPSSVSIILNRMVVKGLITKTHDKEKKNLIRVSFTKKGERIYRQILKDICISRIMSNLSDQQYEGLKTALNVLLETANGELQRQNISRK